VKFTEDVPDALDGQRLDRVVTMISGCSRSDAAAWIDAGLVVVDGQVGTTRSARVVSGQHVVVHAPEPTDDTPQPDAAIEYAVVHEDEHLVVIDKPAGLVVHPGAGHHDGTLVNGLLARYPEIADVGDPDRPGIVHRLDRGTSGLLVVARTPAAYTSLVSALSSHEVERRYDTVVHGHPEADRGLIDAPIGRSGRDVTRMAVSRRGREARTRYEVVQRFATLTRLACELETGRTHQIRVHLAAIGHPVLADRHYGGSDAGTGLERPFLHAAHLSLVHPATADVVEFDAPLADDLQTVLSRLAQPG
jgi:23S rRNA pseudouridine1911/1915/1917 synthase